MIYNAWQYLPILLRKPGALRHGAPFKEWDLPTGLADVRAKLKGHADGDRQFVKILSAVLEHEVTAVEAACAEALEAGTASGDVIWPCWPGSSNHYCHLASPRQMRCA